MNVTVAISTWNRASLLERTLEAFGALVVPPGVDWELLVVNNNCTDRTDEVLARREASLPLRRLWEGRQGLSAARNRAVEAARGQLILFTDDDVLVDPGWMAAYVDCARRRPEAVCFGGRIDPWYETPPPRWVEANVHLLHGLLGVRDFCIDEGPFPEGQAPFGANMAMRREVFDAVRFDPNLGLCGAAQMQGEETALFAQLSRAGHQPVWVPQARLRHFVRAETMTRAYLWRRFHGHGRTLARTDGPHAASPAPRAPWFLLAKASVERLLGRPHWVRTYMAAARSHGMAEEQKGSLARDHDPAQRAR